MSAAMDWAVARDGADALAGMEAQALKYHTSELVTDSFLYDDIRVRHRVRVESCDWHTRCGESFHYFTTDSWGNLQGATREQAEKALEVWLERILG